MLDRNCLSYWLPLIQGAGLPTPDTDVHVAAHDLTALLDGVTPPGWQDLVTAITASGDRLGWPCFLRTGHTSGKHNWADTCRVPGPADVAAHVAALVEASALADIMGLPTRVWAVRRMLDIAPLFHCERYGDMPVTREFRLFATGAGVYHIQPYWPPAAIADGRPSVPESAWAPTLAAASSLTDDERQTLEDYARGAAEALAPGAWSVDLVEDRSGRWWIIDAAEATRSFRWDPPPSSMRVAGPLAPTGRYCRPPPGDTAGRLREASRLLGYDLSPRPSGDNAETLELIVDRALESLAKIGVAVQFDRAEVAPGDTITLTDAAATLIELLRDDRAAALKDLNTRFPMSATAQEGPPDA